MQIIETFITYTFSSMSHFKRIVWLWGLFSLLSSGCKGESFDFAAQRLLVLSNGDKESVQAADYLFQHLQKRNTAQTVFQVKRSDSLIESLKGVVIYIEVVEDLQSDYEIVNEYGRLSLFGKNRSILRWLTYMLIDKLGEYHTLDIADVPPGYLEFKTGKADFALRYRDPHLLPNMDQDISGILLTHNVDRDWGLWGHNLRKVFTKGTDTNAMALVDGKRDVEQYCFSSQKTFQAIKDFILEEYGSGSREGKWFMIAPNDNDKVCTCASCKKQGNTSESATAAVVLLLNRLATEFPEDYFYTTAYRTTRTAPTIRLADHVGVLVSTIDLPKSPELKVDAPLVQEFSTLLTSWKEQTNHIYLWDYISNFDDYITPFPTLRRVQTQLSYFRELGVNGMFLNGSGYDYSPFDDVKTYVLSAVMLDPSLSVPDLVKRYHERFYPISAGLLTDYLLEIEDSQYNQNKDIALYSSFRQLMRDYFAIDRFNTFYSNLEAVLPRLAGDEERRIRLMLGALSYTKLQLAYHKGTVANNFLEVKEGRVQLSSQQDLAIDRLRGVLKEGVVNYKEEKGDLQIYLKEWDQLRTISRPVNAFKVNKAVGISSAEVMEDAELLCDNKVGFVSDFNIGWFLAGEDVNVMGKKENKDQGDTHVEMRFLVNVRHRMLVPDRIELWSAGAKLVEFAAADFVVLGDTATLKKNIDLSKYKELEIKIYKNRELKNSVIACDEIQLY